MPDVRTRRRHAFRWSLVLIPVLATLMPYAGSATGVDTVGAHQRPMPTRPVFPDEFSDLDEGALSSTAGEWDEVVIEKLEIARKRYLTALTAIENKDTAKAAKLFERALDILNDLASYPRIEENSDFTDLAQSIIEDYENYIQNIDALDENSSIFILREKVFEQVDAPPSVAGIPTPPPALPANVVIPSTQIPLVLNEHVEKNLTFMSKDKGRKFFKKWLERGGRWMDMLKRIAKEEGMPEEIVYLSMMESGLNPTAVSRAKAVGLWQFMQATGEEYDLDVTFWHDERREPEKATRAAMRFLRDLYNDLGDWHLALAAYNCGAGGVKRAIRKSGLTKPTFWEIREHLPRETRNYVPLYIATSIITMNREAYGFPDDSLEMHPVYDYDTYVVKEPCNITALAKCANISSDSLRFLNPELVRQCTPPGKTYALKIPRGTLASFGERFAMLTDDEKQPWLTHRVERGETLAKIAARYGVPAGDVATINGLSGYKARLRRGSTLRIPIGGTTLAAARTTETTTTTTTTTASSTNAEPATLTMAVPTSGKATHVVRSGESLHSIAKRYGVRMADLRNWNDIPYDNENIRIGDSLIVGVTDQAIPPMAQQNVERIAVRRTVKHTVAKGESLASVATLYGTTPERIRSLNNMTRKATLMAGRTINVETSLSKSELASLSRTRPEGKPVTHKVRSGESLGGIAATYGVDENDLRRWNADVVDGTTVFAGTKLKVYTSTTAKGSSAVSQAKRAPKTYRVRSGDSLVEIAEKFGLSVESIRAKNRSLRQSTTLRAGQVIRLQ